jgi:hypothetical protein
VTNDSKCGNAETGGFKECDVINSSSLSLEAAIQNEKRYDARNTNSAIAYRRI